jgi:hypothetical protein
MAHLLFRTLLVVLLLALTGCGSSSLAPSGAGIVTGQVQIAACGGVVRPIESCPPQPSKSVVSFYPVNGGPEISAKTDNSGAYSVSVPSGTYIARVDGMTPGEHGQASLSGPAEITVRSGRVATLDFLISVSLD